MGLHRSLGGQLTLGRTAGFEPCTSVLELGSQMLYALRHQNFQSFINLQEGAPAEYSMLGRHTVTNVTVRHLICHSVTA